MPPAGAAGTGSSFLMVATALSVVSTMEAIDAAFCNALLDTFNGKSGQSMTPFNNSKNSGITSLILSAINTWLLYN